MKKTILIITLVVVSAAFLAAGGVKAGSKDSETAKKNDPPFTPAQIKHGEYLVNSMGCDDCHSPRIMGPRGPELDMAKRFSGHPASMPLPPVDKSVLGSWVLLSHTGTAAVGPWGVSFSANISGDVTGIGNWQFENFKTAMRKGKFKGLENGRDLLPPMPWQQFKNLTDNDLRDMFAYLKSTKPVENVVPAPIPLSELK